MVAHHQTVSQTSIIFCVQKEGDDKAREFIKHLTSYVTIISITHADVLTALDSEFKDFEDSLQNACAERHQADVIITRNVKDYSKSELAVRTPIEFLSSLSDNHQH